MTLQANKGHVARIGKRDEVAVVKARSSRGQSEV
jgi:hypothetical protein